MYLFILCTYSCVGPKFLPPITVHLCEIYLKEHAESIVSRQFTRNGTKTCFNVCCQYRSRMMMEGPVDIKLTETYCGLNGDSQDDEQDSCDPDLSTTCTCAYRVECNYRTKILLYHFEANCDGYLRVTASTENTEVKQKIT